jgi:hypothetical protein
MVLTSVDWFFKFKIIFRFNFSFFEMQDSLDRGLVKKSSENKTKVESSFLDC